MRYFTVIFCQSRLDVYLSKIVWHQACTKCFTMLLFLHSFNMWPEVCVPLAKCWHNKNIFVCCTYTEPWPQLHPRPPYPTSAPNLTNALWMAEWAQNPQNLAQSFPGRRLSQLHLECEIKRAHMGVIARCPYTFGLILSMYILRTAQPSLEQWYTASLHDISV